MLVLEPYLYDTAPGQRFRIEQWAPLLRAYGVVCTFASFESEALNRVMYRRGFLWTKAAEVLKGLWQRLWLLKHLDAFDTVFLFREAAPVGPPFLERLLARSGKLWVYDFDDAIFLPNSSSVNRIFSWMKCSWKTAEICELSTHVTVGNAYLAAYAKSHNPRTTIIPTTIDTSRYFPKNPSHNSYPLTIGWMGSMTTIPHLLSIQDALKELATRHHFVLHVVSPTEVAIPGVPTRFTRWSACTEVSDLHAFDIGIMPLQGDEWAKGKCGAKILQYMGVGVPAVCSPVGVNVEIITEGVNGFHASSQSEWVDKLSWLIQDESLRAKIGQAGRQTVEERYSARAHVPRLREILRLCTQG